MKIAVWHNLTQKGYEATFVGRGRPVRQDASLAEREKSSREYFVGKSKEEALQALANIHGLTLDEVTAAVTKSKMVYKGKRENPYVKKSVTEVIEA